MSVQRFHYVSCDRCGLSCGMSARLTSGVAARALARKQGWLRVARRTALEGGSPGADYCPDCKAAKP